jgi:hypothetical protein
MTDTPMRMEKRYQEMILSRTPAERLKMASGMYDSGKKLVISGIQKEGRLLNASQLRAQLFLRMYGNDFSATEIEKIMSRIPDMELAREKCP